MKNTSPASQSFAWRARFSFTCHHTEPFIFISCSLLHVARPLCILGVSEEGFQPSESLRQSLAHVGIQVVHSRNKIRESVVSRNGEVLGVYNPAPDVSFEILCYINLQ